MRFDSHYVEVITHYLIDAIALAMSEGDGATFDPATCEPVQYYYGYQVGGIIPSLDIPDPENVDLDTYAGVAHAVDMALESGWQIWCWRDPETGFTVVDVCDWVDCLEAALDYGIKRGEREIFDWEAGDCIPV